MKQPSLTRGVRPLAFLPVCRCATNATVPCGIASPACTCQPRRPFAGGRGGGPVTLLCKPAEREPAVRCWSQAASQQGAFLSSACVRKLSARHGPGRKCQVLSASLHSRNNVRLQMLMSLQRHRSWEQQCLISAQKVAWAAAVMTEMLHSDGSKDPLPTQNCSWCCPWRPSGAHTRTSSTLR